MTEAQEEFIRRMAACREEIIDASGELDAVEGHGPGGEQAIEQRCLRSTPLFRLRRNSRLAQREPGRAHTALFRAGSEQFEPHPGRLGH
jgi:hypothetical protein